MGDNNYKRRHRELGLCTDCSHPSVPGRRRCATHLQNHADQTKKAYHTDPEKYREVRKNQIQQRKDEGRCPSCGAPADSGFITCGNCSSVCRPPMGVPIFKHKTMRAE